MKVLDDEMISEIVTPALAADAMREALVAAWRGTAPRDAPPRRGAARLHLR